MDDGQGQVDHMTTTMTSSEIETTSKIGWWNWNYWARIHVSKAFLMLSWMLWILVQAVIPLFVVHWRIQRYIQRPNRRVAARVIHVM